VIYLLICNNQDDPPYVYAAYRNNIDALIEKSSQETKQLLLDRFDTTDWYIEEYELR